MSKNNAIVVTSIISGVILVIALIALFTLSPASTENTVNVQGIATVSAMPDEIGVYFNIQTNGETSSEAKDANSEIYNKLLTELVLQGFERKEIVTENFIDLVDHKNLNEDVKHFNETIPTVENIASFAWDCLSKKIDFARLSQVTVWESDRTSCTYTGQGF